MGLRNDLDPIIPKLNLDNVINYLTTKGWTKTEGKKSSLLIFRRPDNELNEIIIVKDSNFSDYKIRLSDAISFISQFENRQIGEVLNDLLLPQSDVIKFRLSNTDTEDGTIPFKDVLAFMESSKKALMATAAFVIEPRKHIPRIATKEAIDFINACRFGQTERGSFVANIICPLNALGSVDPIDQEELFPQMPSELFTRKVTKSFIKTVDYLAKSIEANTTNKILEPNDDEIIISSNLCESLMEMNDKDKFTLQITLKAAPIGPPIDGLPQTVILEKRYFEKIAELSLNLREKEKPKKGFFIGHISLLKRDALHDELLDGQIVISIFDDEKNINARVVLSKADYEAACDIHKKGGYISIEGKLLRRGKFYYIEDYTNFKSIKPQT